MLKMMRDRILVQPIERQLSSVLIVKNTEKTNLGTVIAVGPGKEVNGRIQPMDVKIGDTVRYGEFTFPEFKEGGVAYQILQEADVAAVVEESALDKAFGVASARLATQIDNECLEILRGSDGAAVVESEVVIA